MSSPMSDVMVALDEAICGDPEIADVVTDERMVYSGVADEDAVSPYFVLTSPSEDNRPIFNGRSKDSTVTIQFYSPEKTFQQCLYIYDQLERLLNFKTLVLASHTFIQGSLRLVIILSEQDSDGSRLVAEYKVISRGPA